MSDSSAPPVPPLAGKDHPSKIQELERLLALARQNEEKFRSMHDSSPDCVKELDLEGRLLSMNKFGMYLMEVDDFSSCHLAYWPDFWKGKGHTLALQAFTEAKAGRPGRFQGDCPTLKGVLKSWDVIVAPILDAQGRVTSIMALSRDISEFKRIELKLHEQAQRDLFSAHIGNQLIRNLSLRTMLRECTHAMVNHLGAAFARIWLLNEADSMLELVASSGLYTHIDGGHARVPVGKFKIGLIASERQPHLTNSVIGDSRVPEQEWAQREGMVAFAGYPLIVEDRVLGVMAMFAREPIPQNTLNSMAVVATQIALGIERKLSEEREKKLNAETIAATAKFRSVFDQSGVFAGIMTLDGTVIEANQMCLVGCGYRAEQVIGFPFWDTPWWRNSAAIQNQIKQGTAQAAGGKLYNETLTYWLADGAERIVDFALHPIRNEQGEVIFLHPTGIDITERTRAEARIVFLDQLTEKLSTVSDPDEITRVSTRMIGEFLKTNGCYFFQTLPEAGYVQVLPDWVSDEFPLAGKYNLADFGLPAWWEAVQEGPVAIDDVHDHPWTRDFSANYRVVNFSAYALAPFIQPEGWVGCLAIRSSAPRHWTTDEISLLRDAVARLWPLILRARAEVALRASEERLRGMADNLPNLAWMADHTGTLFWYNQRWYDYTGTDESIFEGWGWQKVHHPDHVTRVVEKWKKHLQSGEVWEDTFPLRGTAGDYRWFLSRATPLRDQQGTIVRWFGTNTDITELREAQLALEQARAELAQNNSQLEERVAKRTADLTQTNSQLETLVYSIAHDLRAPLRSMQAFSTILLNEYASKLDADAQDYATRIARASENMDSLVQDLIIYGRTARAELVLEKVAVESAWYTAVQQHEERIREKNAVIAAVLPLPHVQANEAMLVQAFANLIGNALKFVAPDVVPHITLSAEEKSPHLRLWVSDNGIGIEPVYHERIFRVFERLHGKTFDGTGIGLSIVRKGVEQMGGKVGVESTLGHGSRFWIHLQKS